MRIKYIFYFLSFLVIVSCNANNAFNKDYDIEENTNKQQYIDIINAAERFAKQECLDFFIEPGQNYITMSKFENYNVFKNHHLFDTKDRLYIEKYDDQWLNYLNDEVSFEKRFGWLKEKYTKNGFWGISNFQQMKNPSTVSGGIGSWDWIFVDAEKMEGIPDPKIKSCIKCPKNITNISKNTTNVSEKDYQLNDKDQLYSAVFHQDIKKLDAVLGKKIPLDKYENERIFSEAISVCNSNILLRLLDHYKIHPYHINFVIDCGDSLVIEKMLKGQGAIKDDFYFDHVNKALMFLKYDIVAVLIKYWKENKFGSDALNYYLSIVANDLKTVEKFISDNKFGPNYTFDFKSRSKITDTPFWLTVKSRNLEIGSLLIKNGAKVDLHKEEEKNMILSLLFNYGLFQEQEIKKFINSIKKSGVDIGDCEIDYKWDHFHKQTEECSVSK